MAYERLGGERIDMVNQSTAAIIQAGSEVMDKDKGVDKSIRLIKEAGENKV